MAHPYLPSTAIALGRGIEPAISSSAGPYATNQAIKPAVLLCNMQQQMDSHCMYANVTNVHQPSLPHFFHKKRGECCYPRTFLKYKGGNQGKKILYGNSGSPSLIQNK